MKHKLMVVKWKDTSGVRDPLTEDQLKDLQPALLETVGFGYELEDRIVLAMDYAITSKALGWEYRDTSVIPREQIIEIRYLREKEGKAKSGPFTAIITEAKKRPDLVIGEE